MVVKVGKFKTCLKMEISPRTKDLRKKKCGKKSVLDKEDIFSCINSILWITLFCQSASLYFISQIFHIINTFTCYTNL